MAGFPPRFSKLVTPSLSAPGCLEALHSVWEEQSLPTGDLVPIVATVLDSLRIGSKQKEGLVLSQRFLVRLSILVPALRPDLK